jgi:hypothetical protein
MTFESGEHRQINFYHFLDEKTYEHVSVVLAQGLSELGYVNYGSCNYWKEFHSDYLIKQAALSSHVNSVAIISSSYHLKNVNSYESIRKFFNYVILIDSEDGGEKTECKPFYSSFDLVLRCHFNSKIENEKNVIPWQWGITNHMIKWIRDAKEHKSEKIQINFRVPHQARNMGVRILSKQISKRFQLVRNIDYFDDNVRSFLTEEQLHYARLTQNRCLPNYAKRIKDSAIAFSFAGWFYVNEQKLLRRKIKNILIKLRVKIPRSAVLVQFDSWRLWENFFSGVPVVHFDLDLYSARLPIQPINGVHYLGVDIRGRVNGMDLDKFMDNKSQISQAAKDFVNRNYTPSAIAFRFIEALNDAGFKVYGLKNRA